MTPGEEKDDGELNDKDLDDASGGAGPAKPGEISIKKIEKKIAPTAPAFDPNKVMHAPNTPV